MFKPLFKGGSDIFCCWPEIDNKITKLAELKCPLTTWQNIVMVLKLQNTVIFIKYGQCSGLALPKCEINSTILAFGFYLLENIHMSRQQITILDFGRRKIRMQIYFPFDCLVLTTKWRQNRGHWKFGRANIYFHYDCLVWTTIMEEFDKVLVWLYLLELTWLPL